MKKPSPAKEDCNTLLKFLQNGQYLAAENLAITLTEQYPKNQFVWKALGMANDKLGKRRSSNRKSKSIRVGTRRF